MLYGSVAHRSGALVLLVDGAVRLRALVAQGCRPIGRAHVVTRVEDQSVLELDHKPALEALRALFESLAPDDRERFRHSLFVGVEMDKAAVEVRPDRLLVRNLLGIDPEQGAVGVAAPLDRHDVLQFVLRDADSAREELSALLAKARAEGAAPVGALLFTCLGRGRHLFGRTDHDPDLFAEAFDAPVGGFFANGEIAPVAGKTFLHGYTSAFALFERR
jgi:small ligand-binding sensory domain FIST